jgi:hypothetical protein
MLYLEKVESLSEDGQIATRYFVLRESGQNCFCIYGIYSWDSVPLFCSFLHP